MGGRGIALAASFASLGAVTAAVLGHRRWVGAVMGAEIKSNSPLLIPLLKVSSA
jgi:hypothetical protein